MTIIAKYFQIHYKNLSSYASLKDVEYCRIERVKKLMESNTMAETYELNTEDIIKDAIEKILRKKRWAKKLMPPIFVNRLHSE